MVSRGRVVIAAAFAGLGILLLGLVYYAGLDNPLLEKVKLDLVGVKVLEVNSVDKRANLEVRFLVTNPSEKTVTVSTISYNLFINDKDVGGGHYSTQDIALPGRAAIYPGQSVELADKFDLVYSDRISDEYNAIINGKQVKLLAKGQVSIESALSIVEKNFESTFG
ncbi:MAG: hypothetical protein HY295_07295 [Thaumarchaeota archaeon]|nr:hypothetical protein [Nitrososphaerota archaeon]